jgi:hypothetical protein
VPAALTARPESGGFDSANGTYINREYNPMTVWTNRSTTWRMKWTDKSNAEMGVT